MNVKENNNIIQEILEANPNPYLARLVGLQMDLIDVFKLHPDEWPEEVKNIYEKRGGFENIRIKDLIKVEQVLGYQIIKIEK